MIYQPGNGALLTVLFFLYNACSLPQKMDTLWTYRNSKEQAGTLSKTNLVCTIPINTQSFRNCGLNYRSHLHITKPMGPNANGLKLKRDSMGLQGSFCEVLSLLCLCAVYILQGSPSARCLVWRRGLLCQANHDQLGSPAHKEPRRRGLGPVCICRLLTSHLIALTHQLLLLRARVIYLYTDFPQD